MSSPTQRSFPCPACKGAIYIPYELPPTSAPCPHCGTAITSPAQEVEPVAPEPPQREVLAPLPKQPLPAIAELQPAEEPPSRTPWFISVVLLLLLAAGTVIFYQNFVKDSAFAADKPIADTKITTANDFNWQTQARDTLQSFYQAKTVQEKARFVIGGEETFKRLQDQWGETLLEEAVIDPQDFAAIPASQEEGGPQMYLLHYDRPIQPDISKYFRPLVSMEVIQGVDKIDPFTRSVATPANFELPPLKVQAYFLQTDKGLLLDLDIYLQTRYRTLQTFAESALAGERAKFRIIILQDVPLAREKKMHYGLYRITDPIHISDSYRVFTPAGSPASERLKVINWLGIPEKLGMLTPATVVLQKLANGEILLEEHVCWDFEGLGGSPGNQLQSELSIPVTPPDVSSPAPTTVPDP